MRLTLSHVLLTASFSVCSGLFAQSDPCTDLAPYLVNVTSLQRSLDQTNSSEWLNILRDYEKNNRGSSGSGSFSGFGVTASGGGGNFTDSEREALVLGSGALSSATKELLREDVRSVSGALQTLVDNCTRKRDRTVVYAEQHPDVPAKFTLHITFDPEVETRYNEGVVLFDRPVRCSWSTTDVISRARLRHVVPLKRPNGAIAQCDRADATGAVTIATSTPLPVMNSIFTLPSLKRAEQRRRWSQNIPVTSWDGNYTAYISNPKVSPITSDPISTDSHIGYRIRVPQRGSYLLLIDYSAATARSLDISVAGQKITTVHLPPSRVPDSAQAAKIAVLNLESGENILDLRAATMAGLPNIYSLTLAGLEDLP